MTDPFDGIESYGVSTEDGWSKPELELVADFVVDNGLAVVFSQRIDGEDPEAGKKGRRGWQLSASWPKQNRDGLIAQLKHHYGKRNLLVVTRPSNVLTIDCDTWTGVAKLLSMNPPETARVKSGRDDGGYHYIFRPPYKNPPYTFFELSGDAESKARVSGAASTKLHVLAGFHKSGREYEIDHYVELATLPKDIYERLTLGYGYNGYQIRSDLTRGELVQPSGRHEHLKKRAIDLYEYHGIQGRALAKCVMALWEEECVPEKGRNIPKEAEDLALWVERSRG